MYDGILSGPVDFFDLRTSIFSKTCYSSILEKWKDPQSDRTISGRLPFSNTDLKYFAKTSFSIIVFGIPSSLDLLQINDLKVVESLFILISKLICYLIFFRKSWKFNLPSEFPLLEFLMWRLFFLFILSIKFF